MPNNLHRIPALEATATKALITPNSLLETALKNSNSATPPLPKITINPLQGQFLAVYLQLVGAKRVLEVGTLGGYSSIWFASTGAHVTTIEINPHHAAVARKNTESLRNVEVVEGAALDVLPRLVQEGREFDFVFIDAAWTEQGEYFEWATKLVRLGGGVYVDNVVREILEREDEEKEGQVQGHKGLLDTVGSMGGVKASVITTTSGWKGKDEEAVDGFLLAIVEKK